MISDFGKALDPLAYKLTQVALLLCLLSKYDLMLGLIVIFGLCEITKLTFGIIIAKKHEEVNGAKWYGKANTVSIYATMMALILFPQMNDILANALMLFGLMMAGKEQIQEFNFTFATVVSGKNGRKTLRAAFSQHLRCCLW